MVLLTKMSHITFILPLVAVDLTPYLLHRNM